MSGQRAGRMNRRDARQGRPPLGEHADDLIPLYFAEITSMRQLPQGLSSGNLDDHELAKRSFSFLAGALLASFAYLLADGLAPSRLVRVGTCLGGRFPRRNLCLGLGRRVLLLEKFGRHPLAILLSPAAKETHGVIVDGRPGDSWISWLK